MRHYAAAMLVVCANLLDQTRVAATELHGLHERQYQLQLSDSLLRRVLFQCVTKTLILIAYAMPL